MITDYRNLTGPAFDDDCQCHCSGRAADLQDALDEIQLIVGDPDKPRRLDTMTDDDIRAIAEQAARR